jgi:hypothetical protein
MPSIDDIDTIAIRKKMLRADSLLKLTQSRLHDSIEVNRDISTLPK